VLNHSYSAYGPGKWRPVGILGTESNRERTGTQADSIIESRESSLFHLLNGLIFNENDNHLCRAFCPYYRYRFWY